MAELCPGGHWYDCRCKPPREMIINNEDGFALYPGMGMFRAGECLICPSRETGVHAWQALIEAYPATRISRRELERHLFIKGGRNMFISFSDEVGVPCVLIWSVGSVLALKCNKKSLIMPQLRRIQRAIRKFIKHRRWLKQARRVFTRCMQNSCLSPDLVQHICLKYVK